MPIPPGNFHRGSMGKATAKGAVQIDEAAVPEPVVRKPKKRATADVVKKNQGVQPGQPGVSRMVVTPRTEQAPAVLKRGRALRVIESEDEADKEESDDNGEGADGGELQADGGEFDEEPLPLTQGAVRRGVVNYRSTAKRAKTGSDATGASFWRTVSNGL